MIETVNHPKHYNAHASGVETIDIVEHMTFNLGNAVKYVWRAGEKGSVLEDWKKARWYLKREIDRVEKAISVHWYGQATAEVIAIAIHTSAVRDLFFENMQRWLAHEPEGSPRRHVVAIVARVTHESSTLAYAFGALSRALDVIDEEIARLAKIV